MKRTSLVACLSLVLTACAPSCSAPVDMSLPQHPEGGQKLPVEFAVDCPADLKGVLNELVQLKNDGKSQAEAVIWLQEQKRLGEMERRLVNGLYTADAGTSPEMAWADVTSQCLNSDHRPPEA